MSNSNTPKGANAGLWCLLAPIAVTLDTVAWRPESPCESVPHREFEFPAPRPPESGGQEPNEQKKPSDV